MEQMYSCPNCGAVVYYGEQVCQTCGIELDWSATEAPPPGDEYQYQDYGQDQQQYDQQQYDQQQWQQPPQQYQQPDYGQYYPAEQQMKPGGTKKGRKVSSGITGKPRPRMKLINILVLSFLCVVIAGAAIWIGLTGNPFDSTGDNQNNGSTPVTGNQTSQNQPVAGPIDIISFSVNPGVIPAGEDSTLSWEVTGANQVSIDQGIGTVPPTGSQVITPDATTTYKLTASNESGSKTASTTISVNIGVPLITFTANPETIVAGGESTLTWEVKGATSITLKGTGSVAATGTKEVSPESTTTYTLIATNSQGVIEATATVSIGTSGTPTVTSFTASPDFISPGESSTLEWYVTNASSVTINQGIGSVEAYGSKTVNPELTTIYTLTASNSAGSTTLKVTVTTSATGEPVVSDFSAIPQYITSGGSSTLTWHVAGADTIFLDPGNEAIEASGTKVVSPTTTTEYKITATNENGTIYAYRTVTFSTVPLPVINSFDVNPSTITIGSSAVLSWNVSGANTIQINNGIGSVSPIDSEELQPPAIGTYTYTITAANDGGSVSDNATLTVYSP